VYAEDPDNDFFPSPGTIQGFRMPSGPGVRVDSGAYDGWTVPIEYDPLIAKIISRAETRDAAVERLLSALRETFIGGIKTSLGFFRRLLADGQFRAGNLHTGFIEEFLSRSAPGVVPVEIERVAALVAAVRELQKQRKSAARAGATSRWLAAGRSELLR
jgi:acetyl-CoA carboxylase biotin carboxylase subunit